MTQKKRIGILTYDGCMGVEVFAITDTLRIASNIAQALQQGIGTDYEIELLAVRKSSVRLAGDIEVKTVTPRGIYELIIVPGPEIRAQQNWSEKLAPFKKEFQFLRESASQGSRLASICVGSFLLAEAGLLKNKRVTTAWLFAEDFRERYPDCLLDTKEILIEDELILSTAAMSASFDLAMHLIKQLMGEKVARATARLTLLHNPRPSQAPFIDRSLMKKKNSPFSQSVESWLRTHLQAPFDLKQLAQRFLVSERTLLRRIKADTGLSPLVLLQNARIEKAKHLLCSGNTSVARIIEEVGYQDIAAFSRLFSRTVGESPAKYRRRMR
jgi:transcriptional regulator GlxA family with amidase domain